MIFADKCHYISALYNLVMYMWCTSGDKNDNSHNVNIFLLQEYMHAQLVHNWQAV